MSDVMGPIMTDDSGTGTGTDSGNPKSGLAKENPPEEGAHGKVGLGAGNPEEGTRGGK